MENMSELVNLLMTSDAYGFVVMVFTLPALVYSILENFFKLYNKKITFVYGFALGFISEVSTVLLLNKRIYEIPTQSFFLYEALFVTFVYFASYLILMVLRKMFKKTDKKVELKKEVTKDNKAEEKLVVAKDATSETEKVEAEEKPKAKTTKKATKAKNTKTKSTKKTETKEEK